MSRRSGRLDALVRVFAAGWIGFRGTIRRKKERDVVREYEARDAPMRAAKTGAKWIATEPTKGVFRFVERGDEVVREWIVEPKLTIRHKSPSDVDVDLDLEQRNLKLDPRLDATSCWPN
jgi:hypothetical protein